MNNIIAIRAQQELNGGAIFKRYGSKNITDNIKEEKEKTNESKRVCK